MKKPPKSEQGTASGSLAALTLQADAVRAELSRLRRNLAALHQQEHAGHTQELREANEKLLIAALDASAVAESAKESLAGLIVSSQRDALTNTPNRALTLERLENAIGMAKRHGALMAVLFVDIDHLKLINDSLGHAAGDAALQLAARRLESVVRSTDTVSRHGGDEFVVLLSELSQLSDAAGIATKMLEALAVPTQVGGHVLSLTASIGIAIYPLDAATGPQLIEMADSAMYVVKRLGGSRFGFQDSTRIAGNAPAPEPIAPRQPGLSERPGVAQLRQVNEQLVMTALAAHELKDLANQARGNEIKFLAMVAHELRNPLTAIQLAADMLSLGGTDEAQPKRLKTIIEDEVRHLVYLIEDLLDVSRVNTGKLRMELSEVDVNAILANAVEANASHIADRFQTIETKLSSKPILVRGSKVRLRQIFSNLLDNASKYTPAGGHIEVDIEAAGGEVRIVVSDNGIGIPSHALPHIFDLFVQEAGALTLHSGGLGIGLALVHELVAAHHGTVSAQSSGRNQGSKFIVTFPAA
ncbi:diguanylate cyclase domain-containing protein [Pseudoxanthomonas wuyuanensis]